MFANCNNERWKCDDKKKYMYITKYLRELKSKKHLIIS